MRLFSLLSWMRGERRPVRGRRPGRQGRPVKIAVEALEDRYLMSANVISGYVYDDVNHNGIFDAGETGIAHNQVELRDSANRVIATATTNAQGYYEFTRDQTVDTSPQTLERDLAFPETPTAWDQTGSVAQFDPSLGTLTSVEIVSHSALTSTIRVESLDATSSTIGTTVSGTIQLTGPGSVAMENKLANTRTFSAGAYDGTIDFGGASGHDFGPITVEDTGSKTLTSAADLALFTGAGSVSFHETAKDTSTANGSANLLLSLRTKAAGDVKVIYHYTPSDALKSGNYVVVQPNQPDGFIDGQETRGNATPLPNSIGTDAIALTLNGQNLPGNNFGEMKASSLSGSVFVDANNNGVREGNETGIGNVTVWLSGTDDTGSASKSVVTHADGSYTFADLRPGTYTVAETQPTGYISGINSPGTLGGTVNGDQINQIVVPTGVAAPNYNFGELKVTTSPIVDPEPVPTPGPGPGPGPGIGKQWFLASTGRRGLR